MSGHLCLKWNNHSSAFIASIGKIQLKERYCDATIACQGKYFPVHRIVLSTCSDYFDEMFQRMQSQHPYIVFKDIEPREMELLLNYMYQGEVNVVQEMLPTLIKAAEALKVKGLAVPDDLPVNNSKESSGRKRSNPGNENPQPKRRLEESRRRRSPQNEFSDSERHSNNESSDIPESAPNLGSIEQQSSIKQEPVDSVDYNASAVNCGFGSEAFIRDESGPSLSNDSAAYDETEFGAGEGKDKINIKMEQEASADDAFAGQSSNWEDDFGSEPPLANVGSSAMGGNDDMCGVSGMSADPTAVDEDWMLFDEETNLNTTSTLHRCPFCFYKSNKRTNVDVHIKYKHTGERPFPCSVCPRRFVQKICLVRHIRSHTGEKPFQCSMCPMKFTRSSNLNAHLKSKHHMTPLS